MKKKHLLVLAFPAMALVAGCCGSVDAVLKLADLVFSSEYVRENIGTTASSTIDRFLVSFENADIQEGSCECTKTTQEAGAEEVQWNIYYNETTENPSEWGTPVESASIPKNPLKPCAEEETFINSEFLQAGYYLVETILDYAEQVDERDENNNEYDEKNAHVNTFEENAKYGNNRKYTIVKVDLANPQHHYEGGKEVFARILEIK